MCVNPQPSANLANSAEDSLRSWRYCVPPATQAILGYFWCGVAAIFISKYGITVFRAQTVCGKFKFHVPVVDEISLCRGDLLLFHDKRIQILKGLPG